MWIVLEEKQGKGCAIVSSGLILENDIWRARRTMVMNSRFFSYAETWQLEAVALICFNKIILD
jgi:hypothetical protein